MSSDRVEPVEAGASRELAVAEQLARAKVWAPAPTPVLDDLTDDEEAAFLAVLDRQ